MGFSYKLSEKLRSRGSFFREFFVYFQFTQCFLMAYKMHLNPPILIQYTFDDSGEWDEPLYFNFCFAAHFGVIADGLPAPGDSRESD